LNNYSRIVERVENNKIIIIDYYLIILAWHLSSGVFTASQLWLTLTKGISEGPDLDSQIFHSISELFFILPEAYMVKLQKN